MGLVVVEKQDSDDMSFACDVAGCSLDAAAPVYVSEPAAPVLLLSPLPRALPLPLPLPLLGVEATAVELAVPFHVLVLRHGGFVCFCVRYSLPSPEIRQINEVPARAATEY